MFNRAAHAIDGRGRPSEDRWTIQDVPGGKLFAAVFDGHSGLSSVINTLKLLPGQIVKVWQEVGDDELALRAALPKVFLDHDKTLWKAGPLSYRESGTTASVALVTPKHIIIAHVGDSPAFVMDMTTGKIVQGIQNHEPTRPDERRRILANGGEVTQDEGDAPRVNGMLMVSRAFGDFSLKIPKGGAIKEDTDWAKDLCVTAEPDIIVVPRPAAGVLAIMSDGLVEAPDGGLKPTSQVADAIYGAYKKYGNDLSTITKAVINDHVAEQVDDPREYEGDDLTLLLIDVSLPIEKNTHAVGNVVNKQGIKTRRSKRVRTGKRKLPKTFNV